MVCMLGFYIFDINDVETIKKQIQYKYSKKERIGNHPYTQAVGKWNEKIDFDAVLYYDKASAFIFQKMAEQKIPVWFVMLSGEALEVTIDDITIKRSYFDQGGQPLKQEVSFVLEAYYD